MSTHPGTVAYVSSGNVETRHELEGLLGTMGVPFGIFVSTEEFLAHIAGEDGSTPRCLLIDNVLSGNNPVSLLNALRDRGQWLPVVFLVEEGEVSFAVQAMREGAFDIIEKPLDREQCSDQIMRALASDARQRRKLAQRAELEARLVSLSPRERDVLEQLLTGTNHKVIADRLGISIKTLLKHRAHVLRKIDAHTEVELLLLMTSVGLAGHSMQSEPLEPARHS
jgi:FixJ family two-component response regulator